MLVAKCRAKENSRYVINILTFSYNNLITNSLIVPLT